MQIITTSGITHHHHQHGGSVLLVMIPSSNHLPLSFANQADVWSGLIILLPGWPQQEHFTAGQEVLPTGESPSSSLLLEGRAIIDIRTYTVNQLSSQSEPSLGYVETASNRSVRWPEVLIKFLQSPRLMSCTCKPQYKYHQRCHWIISESEFRNLSSAESEQLFYN